MTAPVLFVAVFTVEGWLRPGYHPFSMFVSELSLGPRGWVQIVNFMVSGALLVVGVILLKVAQQPGTALFAWRGLVQRVVLVAFMGWLFTVAAQLCRAIRP